jgi:hypothetical protein
MFFVTLEPMHISDVPLGKSPSEGGAPLRGYFLINYFESNTYIFWLLVKCSLQGGCRQILANKRVTVELVFKWENPGD